MSFTSGGALVVLTTTEIVVIDPAAQLAREIAPPDYLSSINSFAVSSDGRFLAAADLLGHIRVWDLRSGTFRRTIKATSEVGGGAQAIAFKPGTRTLVVGGRRHNRRMGRDVGTADTRTDPPHRPGCSRRACLPRPRRARRFVRRPRPYTRRRNRRRPRCNHRPHVLDRPPTHQARRRRDRILQHARDDPGRTNDRARRARHRRDLRHQRNASPTSRRRSPRDDKRRNRAQRAAPRRRS